MVNVVSTVPHHSVVKEVVCGHCGATLQYVPRDVKDGMDYDYTGSADSYRYITCPPCNHEVRVR